MSQIWFTSDLHIGHAKVAQDRGYNSVYNHDDDLAANWDALVRADDQVWVLGDVTMSGKRNVERGLQWIVDRPGVKHLIAGNHDECHPMRSQAHKWHEVYLIAFATIQSAAVRKIATERVKLSHFPYEGDHTVEARHLGWRLLNNGEWLIHGHTHSDRKLTSSREIHVGVDAHDLSPVPLSWVEDVIHAGDSWSQ